jgi:hypothetical protein
MANASVTSNVTKTSDILLDLSSKRTFNGVVTLKDGCDSADFFVSQITRFLVLINSCLVTQIPRGLISNTEKVRKRNDSFSVIRNVNTEQTRHAIFSKASLGQLQNVLLLNYLYTSGGNCGFINYQSAIHKLDAQRYLQQSIG